jgi:hypothetical protein
MSCFLLLIACHFIGDFPFQGDWIAQNKGKSFEVMAYHCLIYLSTFVLFAKISCLVAVVLFISHFVIDSLKARYHIVKSIWVDQILHLLIILLIWRV